jgi:predicted aspartyl protease
VRIGLWAGVMFAAVSCSTPQIVTGSSPASKTGSAQDFETALHDGDLAAVQRVAQASNRPPAEVALARAALAYWWREDDQAGDGLTQAAHDSTLSEGLRRNALILLSGLRMRQSRYAEAAASLDAVLPHLSDENERVETKDARDFDAALVGVAPMQANVVGPGSAPLTRDRAGLTRGPVTINSGALDAIIDTGSSVSSISESNARRLGLHFLPGKVSMGTATSSRATAGLALADSLTFGGAEFHNVVFLVMPDSALTFANGAYVVQAIIGMPILLELGRIEYHTDGDKETLSYARTGGKPGANSNLVVEGEEPFTLAHVDGSERVVRLFIDNGANASHLNQRFVAEFPTIIATAHRQAVTRTGAAGSETQEAMKLPGLVLRFGQRAAPIADVDVIDDHKTNRHGDLGLDALRTAPGYVLDFEAMRFELLSGDQVSAH